MSARLVAVEHAKPFFAKVTKVEWFISLLCNFSCSYCAEYARSGHADTEKILRGIDLLKQRTAGRELMLLLGGGEPSYHPEVERICKHAFAAGIHLSMISNGSRSPELYVDLLAFVRSFTFSIHFEQKYEKTMATIQAVQAAIRKENSGKNHLQANIMMSAGHFAEAKAAIEKLEAWGVKYIIRRIRPLYDENGFPILPKQAEGRKTFHKNDPNAFARASDQGYYDEAEIDFLKSRVFTVDKNTKEFWTEEDGQTEVKDSNANDLGLRKLNRFAGWKCWIGIERLHIYPTGDVYRSTCKVGGKLGNIYEDFTFPDSPVICTSQRCTCSWAMNVSKAANQDSEKLLRISAVDK